MKILFLGDYSTVHFYLAQEMRKRGHYVTLVSSCDEKFLSPDDIHLKREKGLFNSVTYLYRILSLLPKLRGYDVVQFINPHFFVLRSGKLNYFLKELRKNNGSLFLSLAGNDTFFVKACCEGKLFRFSEFRVGNDKTQMVTMDPEKEYGWLAREMEDYTKIFYDCLDGAMSMLPEYHMAAEPILGDRVSYTGLPLSLEGLEYTPLEIGDKLKFLVGMRSGMQIQKGTAFLLKELRKIEKKYPDKCEVINVIDLPLNQYFDTIRSSHIVVDQLYSYSPAMNALDSMALGRVAASGAQPEFYDFIGEKELRPLICLDPLREDIFPEFEGYISDPSPLYEMSRQGRELVEKYNDVKIVAKKFEDFWIHRLNLK